MPTERPGGPARLSVSIQVNLLPNSAKAVGAYLVGSAACQPAFKESPSARLRQLDGETFGFKRSDASPATRAWRDTLEAEAHALNGDGAEPIDAAAVRVVDLQRKYWRSGTKLANEVGLSLPRAAALRAHLDIDDDRCRHVLKFGKTKHTAYSDNAFTRMRDAVREGVDIRRGGAGWDHLTRCSAKTPGAATA